MKVRRVCIAASLCRTVWLSLCLMRVRVCQWMHLDASAAMSHVYSFIQMCYRLLLVLWFKAATQIFPLTVPFVSHSKKKKGHFTSQTADLSWQDIIGLQSSFHCKFNTWHTSARVGQACRWKRRWSSGSIPTHHCLWHLQKGTCRKPQTWRAPAPSASHDCSVDWI